MKLTQRLVAILPVILACVVVGCLLALTPESALAKEGDLPVPNLDSGYNIPRNPGDYKGSDLIDIGHFAWQTFVALNWPANDKGEPLKDKDINANPNSPRVWEYYEFAEQVFKPDGFEFDEVAPLRLTEIGSKFDSPGICQDTESNLIKNLELEFDSGDLCGPLVDRAGNYILNETRINPVEADQISKNVWNTLKGLESYVNQNKRFELMCSANDDNGFYPKNTDIPCLRDGGNELEGAIEIKVAWMVLPDADTPSSGDLPDPAQYYTTKRTLVVQTSEGEKTVTVPAALVGFHILRKTSRNGWIWATFEHIDNVPDDLTNPTKDHYNLYDPSCKDCKKNEPLATEPYLWRDAFPHAVTENNEAQTPSQITRLVHIQSKAKDLNSEWQKALNNSLWKNYQLIGVQWLKDPKVPYDKDKRDVKPGNLANVTLEPYVQKSERVGQSCIACHTSAKLKLSRKFPADFSFIMEEEPS